jgi:hypothetical protein
MFNIKCIVISLRGEVWAHLTSLTQPYFIEVSVSCEESDWSSGCLILRYGIIYALRGTNKMKNKKYYSVGTVLKSNRKVVERDKIDIHDHSHSCIGTGTSLTRNAR